MALQISSMGTFTGLDATAVTGLTSCNISSTGRNAHVVGQVLGQVLGLGFGNNGDINQEFVLVQSWTDSSETVANYSLFQLQGFNNAGKQFLVVFMMP